MKFNMTKGDSGLFLRSVLGYTRSTSSKSEMVDLFVAKIGSEINILDKEKVEVCYLELTANILEQYPSVEDFLQKNNFEKAKLVHYYLVEKMLATVFKQRQLKIKSFEAEIVQHMIITHLLNQSRNFYQIESRIFKEKLLKHVLAAQKLVAERKSEPAEVEVSASKARKKKAKRNEDDDEYEYYEEDDLLDEEEKKLIEDENKLREATFSKALEKLKQNTQETQNDKSPTLGLSLTQKQIALTTQGSGNQIAQQPQNTSKAHGSPD